jgi:hypothetical protein
MVVVTFDGTTLKIYIDMELTNTATTWNAGIYSGSSISSTLNTKGNGFDCIQLYIRQ